ncbi:hypothetical protein DWY77_04475 [Megamonas rupellensis]|uniref:Uncharacterized protein n=1 Tax=Megamonas rupellensis TaxID=491921 RepID=A0A412CF52_9FIRM|nr:hypothetical protein [Megamonas rupellensis]RGQ84292.1 hypothetical protein DWY77_04475 [Megamonas rupellensis]
MKKDLSNIQNNNYSIRINGDVNDVQIQQKTNNSSQIYNINSEVDYDKAIQILNEINKYIPMFANTYGENCKIAETALNEALECVSKKKNPSKLRNALSILKDVSLQASSSLIATGILELLKQIKI